MELSREKIRLPENMMRQAVSEQGLENLMLSIKEIGIINPIIVRKVGEEYELVAGLRRYLVAQTLRMEKVYVKVVKASDTRAERIKVDENKEREDIDPIDEGVFFEKLMEMHGWKQKELATVLRVSESYVSQRLSAVNWPEVLRECVKNKELTFSVAREFAGIKNYDEMVRVIGQAISGGVSPAVAARWRQEINRELLKSGGNDSLGDGGMETGQGIEVVVSCQVCGGPGQEIGYKLIRACKTCLEIIQVGREKGVFRQGEQEKGVPPGEAVE